MTAATLLPDDQKLQELEEKFDPEMRFRPTMPPATQIVKWLLIALSAFHYYTAGFGLLQEITHRGVHLAFVLGMIFLVFAFSASSAERSIKSSLLNPGGVPLVDWLLAGACAVSVLYIPYVFDDLMFRVGNPSNMDVIMGSILFISLLEATRRSMGWPLPIIAIGFTVYALLGPYFPGLLKHAGANWSMMINHQYLTSQGIYGVAVGVVATYVFHFVLFGVMATRIGLGQLFLDVASTLAGRYVGGPAKVSVFGSALFGMLSGSSVANAVTVGSLTIPAMIRVGYKKHFAAAVEAASSTGGQITPPVLGAAAFLMIEFLNVPYQTIVAASVVPAFMHFFGVFMQVHFEAKRYGLRGLTEEEMPRLRSSCAIVGMTTRVSGNQLKNWALLVVMHVILMTIAFSDFGNENSTIKMVLFVVAVLTGAAAYIWGGVRGRIEPHVLVEALETGAKYALAVGAAAATVGIVIGVVTLTGVGFKISYIITQAAQSISAVMGGVIPSDWMSLNTLTLLAALIMTGLVCILMGCGVPTTATYIIMVTVAAPTLVGLGVEPLVAHFFVFYYGVLADITPPVALAAYAAAGMAGSDPFKTGNTAFRLGLAKALVPFVFVFSPSLLLVAKGFTWESFIITFTGCIFGITLMAASLSKFMFVEMKRWEQLSCLFAALLMIAPSLTASLVGVVMVIPMFINQWRRSKINETQTIREST